MLPAAGRKSRGVGAAVAGVGVSQLHHLFLHGFVLRLQILLLHCKRADKAVIKENKGLGSNTPSARSSQFPVRNQPHIGLKAGSKHRADSKAQAWQQHTAPELFLALAGPRPDK